jgi:glutathione synthase
MTDVWFTLRAGYAPTDYPTEAEWAARAKIEHSNAAKCPTVAYQLAGEMVDVSRSLRVL